MRRVALLALWAFALGFTAVSASAAVFVVDSTGDEPDADVTNGLCRTALGTCTLRAAMEQANALAGADTVQFAIPGTGVHTIAPASPLPVLTDDAGITIDGYTQPGASPNTLAVGDNAVLQIEIDGSGVSTYPGVIRVVGSYATIRGLVIGFGPEGGISIEGGFGHQVLGCFLGTDASGTSARPNHFGVFVFMSGSPAVVRKSGSPVPSVCIVGGTAPGDRNLLSGNSSAGVAVSGATGSQVLIEGNFIGTDASGTAALSNAVGVSLGASIAVVGGTDPGASNLISGNQTAIISMEERDARIIGNRIGTDVSGVLPIPNGSGIQLVLNVGTSVLRNIIVANTLTGIHVFGGSDISILGNTIGSSGPGMGNGGTGIFIQSKVSMVGIGIGEGNVIAYSGGAGIQIGSSPTDLPTEISISQNSIHDNAGLGIDLGGDGVTPNNDCDPGRGPNLGQNFPVVASATVVPGGTRVQGSLNSVPGLGYQLDFYASPTCDPSGYGQGETWIGFGSVMTDSSCSGTFDAVLPITVAAGSVVTATATDPAGNTSEFSACRPLATGQEFSTIPPCRLIDTRTAPGPYGGPALSPGADRTFAIAGQCGIPADAKAVALNVTVTAPTAAGDVRLFATGTLLPLETAVNYSAAQTRARDGVFALGLNGSVDTHVNQPSGSVHLVVDVSGYFE